MIYSQSTTNPNKIFVVLQHFTDQSHTENLLEWMKLAIWMVRNGMAWEERAIINCDGGAHYPTLIALSQEDAVVFKLTYGGRTIHMNDGRWD